MSWRRVKLFKCAICGTEKEAEDLGEGCYVLPLGWIGSDWKHRMCICSRCRKAIEKLSLEMEGDDKSWS